MSTFAEELVRYERYDCAEDPNSALCRQQASMLILLAQQQALREAGVSGVSVAEVEKALARGDVSVGGQPAARARQALTAGLSMAMSATRRPTPPPKPTRPTGMDQTERDLTALLMRECKERGGAWYQDACTFARPLPPVTYMPATIRTGLSSGQKAALGAGVAVVAVGFMIWVFR